MSRLLTVAGVIERLVPDMLWQLFQRVVPEAPTCPQGGGRRRHGDREVLAAIVLVATSGCTATPRCAPRSKGAGQGAGRTRSPGVRCAV